MNENHFGHPPFDQWVQLGFPFCLQTVAAGRIRRIDTGWLSIASRGITGVDHHPWNRSSLPGLWSTVDWGRCCCCCCGRLADIVELQLRQRLPARLQRIQIEQQVVWRKGKYGNVQLWRWIICVWVLWNQLENETSFTCRWPENIKLSELFSNAWSCMIFRVGFLNVTRRVIGTRTYIFSSK